MHPLSERLPEAIRYAGPSLPLLGEQAALHNPVRSPQQSVLTQDNQYAAAKLDDAVSDCGTECPDSEACVSEVSSGGKTPLAEAAGQISGQRGSTELQICTNLLIGKPSGTAPQNTLVPGNEGVQPPPEQVCSKRPRLPLGKDGQCLAIQHTDTTDVQSLKGPGQQDTRAGSISLTGVAGDTQGPAASQCSLLCKPSGSERPEPPSTQYPSDNEINAALQQEAGTNAAALAEREGAFTAAERQVDGQAEDQPLAMQNPIESGVEGCIEQNAGVIALREGELVFGEPHIDIQEGTEPLATQYPDDSEVDKFLQQDVGANSAVIAPQEGDPSFRKPQADSQDAGDPLATQYPDESGVEVFQEQDSGTDSAAPTNLEVEPSFREAQADLQDRDEPLATQYPDDREVEAFLDHDSGTTPAKPGENSEVDPSFWDPQIDFQDAEEPLATQYPDDSEVDAFLKQNPVTIIPQGGAPTNRGLQVGSQVEDQPGGNLSICSSQPDHPHGSASGPPSDYDAELDEFLADQVELNAIVCSWILVLHATQMKLVWQATKHRQGQRRLGTEAKMILVYARDQTGNLESNLFKWDDLWKPQASLELQHRTAIQDIGPEPEEYEEDVETADPVGLQLDIEAEMQAIIDNRNAHQTQPQAR